MPRHFPDKNYKLYCLMLLLEPLTCCLSEVMPGFIRARRKQNNNWYSAKRAGVKRACPNKAMAHMWFMHDAHLGFAPLFLENLAEHTLLSMTIMVTPCRWYVVGMKLD